MTPLLREKHLGGVGAFGLFERTDAPKQFSPDKKEAARKVFQNRPTL